MAQFLKEIKGREESVIEEFYFQVRENEKYDKCQNEAALVIQRCYKMSVEIKKLRDYMGAIKIIKNYYTLHFQRKQLQKKKQMQIEAQNIQYFSNQLITIQKVFRGFYHRKYIHDFQVRKKQLNDIKLQNQKFLEKLEENQRVEVEEEEKRNELVARSEFEQLALNLHHLSSTKAIPGVYNPPYQHIKPAAFNIPVETHLKATFKAHYHSKPKPKLLPLKPLS